jgi:hypothetical protein
VPLFSVPLQAEAREVVVAGLMRKRAKRVGLEPSDIDTTRPLHAQGVNSPLVVKLHNLFAKLFAANLAIFEIVGQGSSIGLVGITVAARSAWSWRCRGRSGGMERVKIGRIADCLCERPPKNSLEQVLLANGWRTLSCGVTSSPVST